MKTGFDPDEILTLSSAAGIKPLAHLIANDRTFILVPIEDYQKLEDQAKRPGCAHPEEEIYPLTFIPDLGICPVCGAPVQFVGDVVGWMTIPPAEFEALLYKFVEKAESALDQLGSIIYDSRDFMGKVEEVRRGNTVLIAERAAEHARGIKIWEELQQKKEKKS